VDLDGMMGLDSHGNAGLRDKVDHHCLWSEDSHQPGASD
jgi:type IV secretory pathway VirB10-like protein